MVHYVAPIVYTPKRVNRAEEFINYSTSGVFLPSGSRDEYFSKTDFLALILSNNITHLDYDISLRSMSNLGDNTFIIPGWP